MGVNKERLQEARCKACRRPFGSYNLGSMNPEWLSRGETLFGDGFADVILDPREPKKKHLDWMRSTFGDNFIGPAWPRKGTGLYVEKWKDHYYIRIICRRCRRDEKIPIEKLPTGPVVYL